MVLSVPAAAASPRPAVRGGSYRRAFRYLRMLAELGPGAHSLTEISHHVGEADHRSLVHQVLTAGVDESLVLWLDRGRYEVLPLPVADATALPALGRQGAAIALPPGVRPALAALQRTFGGIVVLHGLVTPGPRHVQLAAAPGARRDLEALMDGQDLPGGLPLSQGAAGHAILAYLDPARAARVLARPAVPGGLFSEPLRADLARIRERGHAESRAGDWRTIAVPLLDGTGADGALSVTVRAGAANPIGAGLRDRLHATAVYLASVMQDPPPHPLRRTGS